MDHNPGENTSDRLEKLASKRQGIRRYRCDFGERGVHAPVYIFCRRFSGQLQGAVVTLKDFSYFLDRVG